MSASKNISLNLSSDSTDHLPHPSPPHSYSRNEINIYITPAALEFLRSPITIRRLSSNKSFKIGRGFSSTTAQKVSDALSLKMEVILEGNSSQASGPQEQSSSNVQNERLGIEKLKFDERNRICGVVRRRCRKRSKRKCQEGEMECERNVIQLAIDMTISRSCRYRLSVPVVFWTSVFLILLARGVNSVSDEHSRIIRSPKYEQETDAQGGLIAPNFQETYNVMQFLRELIQRQQHRANQQQLQVYNNGEDLSDGQIDWKKVRVPLLHQIRSIINDGSKEEDKRGSYMSLCHFKICNLG